MRVAIIAFDDFTDIDLFLPWDLLKRVRQPDWIVQILGDRCCHTSATGIRVQTHGRLEEANSADAVLFTSGPGTRARIHDEPFLDAFNLDSGRQLIGSICSGSLILGALGLLEGKRAVTYPGAKAILENMGVRVIPEPFIQEGNVATAAGCLAAQQLAGWIIEKLVGKEEREAVLSSIQPVSPSSFAEIREPAGALLSSQAVPHFTPRRES